jgi:2-hydroxycyclohexanecarboxyl-CoA dehydrogenase
MAGPVTIDLKGRRAFVSGGARGIGAAIAERLAGAGADVVVGDLDKRAALALAARVGGRAIRLDVTDVAAVREGFERYGPFDILINNAGVDQHAFFTDTTPQEWRKLLAVNLESVFACTHAALPAMQAAGFGRIINIASEAGRLGSKGGSIYAAAKGGVIAFTKSLARENARYGITVNAIAPGPIDTPMLAEAIEHGGQKLLDAMAGATLFRRLGHPDEVAAAAVFLTARHSSPARRSACRAAWGSAAEAGFAYRSTKAFSMTKWPGSAWLPSA